MEGGRWTDERREQDAAPTQATRMSGTQTERIGGFSYRCRVANPVCSSDPGRGQCRAQDCIENPGKIPSEGCAYPGFLIQPGQQALLRALEAYGVDRFPFFTDN